jgi:hypothetical protein
VEVVEGEEVRRGVWVCEALAEEWVEFLDDRVVGGLWVVGVTLERPSFGGEASRCREVDEEVVV